MSQGVEWNREEVIELLKPYFKMGCSVTKACKYAGIPQSTVATWISGDELLRLKIENWQSEPNHMARSNWIAKMAEGDYQASVEWLKRREKDDFSERTEQTGADGSTIQPILVRFIDKKDEGDRNTDRI